MSKHTPGPWLIQETTVYALNERKSPVNRFHASVDAGFDNLDKRISREEILANANLIAAAPDLLEALEELLSAYESLRIDEWSRPRDQWNKDCDNDRRGLKAIKVIAKARGEA